MKTLSINQKLKKQKIIALIIIALIFFSSQKTNAAPNVSTVSGNLTNNANMTVEGSAFGTKISNKAEPIRFETWGIGNIGKTTQQATSSWWLDGIGDAPAIVADFPRRVNGQDVLDASIYPSPSNPEASISKIFYRNGTGWKDTGKLHLNFWLYTDLSNSPLNDNIATQMKFLHFPSYIFSDWPWGKTAFVMSYRASSIWESRTPQSDSVGTATYGGGTTLNGGGFRNDLGSSGNIFKQEGWYNFIYEYDQGSQETASGGYEKVSISGPVYSKYGVSKITGLPLYAKYSEWQSGVSNPQIVWYQGKRYSGKSATLTSTIPPPQDPNNWKETPPNDELDSIVFWLWSQKRADNAWNFSYQKIYYKGSSIISGHTYTILKKGLTDFTKIGAADNNENTSFVANANAFLQEGDFVWEWGYAIYDGSPDGKIIYSDLTYKIASRDTFDFTYCGAPNNNIGTEFKATKFCTLTGSNNIVRRLDLYSIGSKVDYLGKAYRCIADNFYGVIPPDQDSAHWEKVLDNHWPSSTTKMFFDSIYIDNSWSRVEIGDNQNYDLCTHREIQIPTSWNNSQIQFTLNQGSFPNGRAYLFVIDENGIPSTGKEINLGQTSTPTSFNISNFTTLLTSWLHFGTSSDLNNDNLVNTKDLGIMMSKWN